MIKRVHVVKYLRLELRKGIQNITACLLLQHCTTSNLETNAPVLLEI